jgi:hypothetical protein
MLKWLRGIDIAWQSEARRRRRRVERRLRAEAVDARVVPSPGLRRRTIAALNDVAYEPAVAAALPRPAAPAYALAFVALLALGVLAARVVIPGSAGPVEAVEPPSILASFDTTAFDTLIRTRLQEFETTWESSLRTEAKLIASDARNFLDRSVAAFGRTLALARSAADSIGRSAVTQTEP